jgi:alkaline phosphatase
MGFEHVRATRMFKSGEDWEEEPLSFETFPARASMTTLDASGGITDSAASATAMATGHKVPSGVISIVDGEDQQTVLERYADLGKRTGLVTIQTPVVDATPAAFGAHATNRSDSAGIADDLLLRSRPNVLFGDTRGVPTQQSVESAGYLCATSLDVIDTSRTGPSHVFGAFANAEPPLLARARTALAVLEQQPEGFFLLLENEGTDESSHQGDLAGVIDAALELERTVDAVLAWIGSRTDTLVVVLADHETGGLTVTETAPEVGVVPAHTFGATYHTSTPVPLFARGPRAETVTEVMDNTDVYTLLGGL